MWKRRKKDISEHRKAKDKNLIEKDDVTNTDNIL